jgi:hypothetical protein
MRAILAPALASVVLATLAACAPTPEGIARVKAEQQAFYERTFVPGAPTPGDPAYDPTACGGDHGMAEQWYQDLRGYPRIGPPQMSICR